MSDLSWLNPTPHAIAVYASRPLSPVAAQHSLPSGRYSLLGPDFHRLDRTSLRLATEPYGRLSRIRLLWGFLCQGCITPFLSRVVTPFFCSKRREHSSIPTAHCRRRRAQRRSRTALLQRRRRLVLDGRQHGGRLPVIGWSAAMIRGEPAIGREQSREPRLYSVEPTWGLDHEAVIRFCGQGSEAAGPFSQRHCSHSRIRIAATSDRHRLPGSSNAVSCRTLFVLSRSRVLLTRVCSRRR